MKPFSFVHTADWQLGKQFAAIAGDAGAALRDRRLEAVGAVGRLAAQRGADAVLVAGDVFDANAVADRTLIRMPEALKTFAGDWVFIPGNHDPVLADSVWQRLQALGLPGNVRLALTPEPLALAEGRAVILPAVLERRHEADDVTAWFDSAATPAGALRIGVAHGSVADLLPGDSEAPNPIAADRAQRARLDYLALGDWHGTLRIDDRTWYSGTPEPDRFRSNDPGNVLVVTLREPGGAPDVEKVRTGHFIWCEERAELRDGGDVAALDRTIAALAPEPDRCLLRLTLAGAVDLAIRDALRQRLRRWEALIRHLDLRDADLIDEPSDDDLDRIDRGGFVRTAVDRLRAKADDTNDPERKTAAMALVRLYETHVGSGG